MAIDSSVPIEDRPGLPIGAWGFRFFESDHDYDIVAHLSADCGFWDQSPKEHQRDSLLSPKNPAKVIKRLTGDGELGKMFNKYYDMLKNYKVIDVKKEKFEVQMMLDSPRYYIFILGLLAMQLGCPIPRKMRRWMKANVNACLFMYERIDQAKMAVFGYENGKPLDLGSKALHEMMLEDNEPVNETDSKAFRTTNVPNNAIFVSTMRMHLDNQLAKQHGGTEHKGVDISNLLQEDIVDPLPHIHNAIGTSPKIAPDLKIDNDTRAATVHSDPMESAKMYSWTSDGSTRDRLAEHNRQGVEAEQMDTHALTELLSQALSAEQKNAAGASAGMGAGRACVIM